MSARIVFSEKFADPTTIVGPGFDPCTVRYVWKFGFVSVPFMSLAAFAFIITMMFVLRSGRSDEEVEPETLEAPSPADERSLAGQGVS